MRHASPSYAEALNRAPKMPKKEFSHMELHPAENGGVVAIHHFTSGMHEPEHHAFGAEDGHKLMQHVAKHMNITLPKVTPDDHEREDEHEV